MIDESKQANADKARHSTKEMVKIAQRVMRDPKSSEDAKSLAGSVISQADPND
jgi:hypothetical protein